MNWRFRFLTTHNLYPPVWHHFDLYTSYFRKVLLGRFSFKNSQITSKYCTVNAPPSFLSLLYWRWCPTNTSARDGPLYHNWEGPSCCSLTCFLSLHATKTQCSSALGKIQSFQSLVCSAEL